MKDRNYLILSPDTLQSFLNSYVEAIECCESLSSGERFGNYFDILKKYATIYQIFKENSSIILDEIDITMDPKKELNFPVADTETYNTIAVAMLADIIEFLIFDEDIKKAGLDIHSNNQAALTSEGYEECRNIIFDYIESQLCDVESRIWHIFSDFDFSDNVMNFLKSNDVYNEDDWIFHLLESDAYNLANALIIVKTQLNLYLDKFLGATVNQNYGFSGKLHPEIRYAVPYVAANTPSYGSVFADRWETLMKTLIMVSASPCPIEITSDILKYVRNLLVAESIANPLIDFTTLPTYQHMKMLFPENVNIFELDEKEKKHVEMVHNELIQRSPAAIRIIFNYYINEVLAKMNFSVEQITSNALNMTSIFASVQGYSGTIDNVNILPHRVIEKAFIDHKENEKNNGGIAMKLIQDSRKSEVLKLVEDSFKLPVNELIRIVLNLFQTTENNILQFSAIIDNGAYFKNFKNKLVAKAILEYFKGAKTTVLYYDETSNKLEFIRGIFDSDKLVSFEVEHLESTDPEYILKITQTEIDKRFTFYDQRHITGSDILQPKNAHAIMTVGPRVLLRDIFQGALRMRQFMSSQKVHLLITESVANSRIKHDRSEIFVSDLLILASLNEDEKQEIENQKLAFQKIDAEIRSFVLTEISAILTVPPSSSGRSKIMSLYKSNRDLFIRSLRETPNLGFKIDPLK